MRLRHISKEMIFDGYAVTLGFARRVTKTVPPQAVGERECHDLRPLAAIHQQLVPDHWSNGPAGQRTEYAARLSARTSISSVFKALRRPSFIFVLE